MERGQRVEFEGGKAGPGQRRGRQNRKLRRDPRMIDRQQPRTARWHARNPDLASRGGRRVAQPAAVLYASLEPEPVSHAAFCTSVRTTKPGGSAGTIKSPATVRLPVRHSF